MPLLYNGNFHTTGYSTEKSSRVLRTKNLPNLLPMASQFSRFHNVRISVFLAMEDPDEIVYVPVVYVPVKHFVLVGLGMVILGKRILGLVASGIGRV